MRISEILNEDSYAAEPIATSEKDVHAIADFIRNNCGEWLSQTNNGTDRAYRGYYRSEDAAAFRKKVRTDRNSKHSPPQVHKSLELLINYGNKVANRSNSIFVTGWAASAKAYGRVFVTLPIGKFNYTWHTKFSDMGVVAELGHTLIHKTEKPRTFSDKMLFRRSPEIGDFWNIEKDSIDTLDPAPIKKWVKGLRGDDGTLSKAISSQNEIMISCDEVVAIAPPIYEMVLQVLHSDK